MRLKRKARICVVLVAVLALLVFSTALAAITCSKCGTDNPEDAKFCKQCGATLELSGRAAALEAARRHVQDAEATLLEAVQRAQGAYDDLKRTKGAEELFSSAEGLLTDEASGVAQEQIKQAAEIALKEEVALRYGADAAGKVSGWLNFTGLLGACVKAYEAGKLAALDAVLIGRNAKTNFQVVHWVIPARRKYDKAVARLAVLESPEKYGLTEGESLLVYEWLANRQSSTIKYLTGYFRGDLDSYREEWLAECLAEWRQQVAASKEPTTWRTLQPPSRASGGDVWISRTDSKAMVFVPAGEFVMGSTDSDTDAYSPEKPQRRVYLDAFWMDKTEVTNAEYRRFVEATGHQEPKYKYWNDSRYNQPKQPVGTVSWEDAVAYARWAGKRLPTEAEWEKAARGTDGRTYPWGNELPSAGGRYRCNYDGYDQYHGSDRAVHWRDGFEYTAPVGSFPLGASPYGCLDMAGNMLEWCADWYDSDYYETGPTRNPKGPASGEYRVLRGGSWGSHAGSVRCANRSIDHPSFRYYDYSLGFRCARTP